MPAIMIEKANADRFDEAQQTLTGGGDGRGCQCQWWTLTSSEFNASTQPEREQLLREQVGAELSPALIGYVDGEAAGWVRVGPRTLQPRLARTRAFTAGSTEPFDDVEVWAVSCFAVRKEHRGQGLNAQLLEAAVAHARKNGARYLEAYPVDTKAGKTSPNELYHGVLSTFESAGFREVTRFKDNRVIVGLDLSA